MTSRNPHDRSASPVGPDARQDDGAGAGVRCGRGRTGPDRATALTTQPLGDRPGARLSGSCDLDSRQAMCDVLGVVNGTPGPVVHLDLSAVVFLDATAVAALVEAASSLNGQGRRLLLHDPPYSLRKVVEMFPDECAALEVAA